MSRGTINITKGKKTKCLFRKANGARANLKDTDNQAVARIYVFEEKVQPDTERQGVCHFAQNGDTAGKEEAEKIKTLYVGKRT